MSCCITSRQLHNSPIFTPSFASGHTHIFTHGTACPEQTQPAGTVWGQSYVWCALLLMTSDLFMDTAEAEWKWCQCHSPLGSMSAVVPKIHKSEQRGEKHICWIINKWFLCTTESVLVTNPSYVYRSISCRGPSLQVRSRLLWSSPYPEAGAGHPPLPEEGQPGQALHRS